MARHPKRLSRESGSLQPWRYWNPDWKSLWTVCSSWSSLTARVGWGDFQRPLPASAILWFFGGDLVLHNNWISADQTNKDLYFFCSTQLTGVSLTLSLSHHHLRANTLDFPCQAVVNYCLLLRTEMLLIKPLSWSSQKGSCTKPHYLWSTARQAAPSHCPLCSQTPLNLPDWAEERKKDANQQILEAGETCGQVPVAQLDIILSAKTKHPFQGHLLPHS